MLVQVTALHGELSVWQWCAMQGAQCLIELLAKALTLCRGQATIHRACIQYILYPLQISQRFVCPIYSIEC